MGGEQLPDSAAGVFLTDAEVEQLEERRYVRTGSIQDSCSICLEDFTDNGIQMVLPCAHAFHPQCVKKWLTMHSSTCPLCKQDVKDAPPFSSAEAADDESAGLLAADSCPVDPPRVDIGGDVSSLASPSELAGERRTPSGDNASTAAAGSDPLQSPSSIAGLLEPGRAATAPSLSSSTSVPLLRVGASGPGTP